MATEDSCCTIVPYFEVHEGKLDEFKSLCERFVAATSNESGALYYGFSFDGNTVHCREGYKDAAGALAHLDNVGELLQQSLQISDLVRLEVHGPDDQLAQLREPLAGFSPQFFTLEYGFRR
jgi:quinol monooxygenase YgiN